MPVLVGDLKVGEPTIIIFLFVIIYASHMPYRSSAYSQFRHFFRFLKLTKAMCCQIIGSFSVHPKLCTQVKCCFQKRAILETRGHDQFSFIKLGSCPRNKQNGHDTNPAASGNNSIQSVREPSFSTRAPI